MTASTTTTTPTVSTKTIEKPPPLKKIIYVCLGVLHAEDCSELYQDEAQAIAHLSNYSHDVVRIEITHSSIKPVMLISKELKVLGLLKRETIK